VRVEGNVQSTVRVQPSNAVARDRRSAIRRKRGKVAAEKNLPIRLDDDDANCAIRVRIKTVECGLAAHRPRYQDQRHRRYGEKLPHFFHSTHLSGANDYFIRSYSDGSR